ncbi:hypothetical protein D9M71_663470 [compost metagenome]
MLHQHVEQRGLAGTGRRKNTHPLTDAAGQQGVNHADRRVQALADRTALAIVRWWGVQSIVVNRQALGRRQALDHLPAGIQYRAEQIIATVKVHRCPRGHYQ